MTSSPWTTKLESKLAALTSSDAAAALAKWMGFNRKHAAAFAAALLQSLKAAEERQTLLLSVVHQVLVLEHDHSEKWNKLADLRTALGENVLLPFLQDTDSSTAPWTDTLLSNIKEWDQYNALGGPTLLHQFRKLLTASSSSSKQPAPKAEEEKEKDEKEHASVDDLLGKAAEKKKPSEGTESAQHPHRPLHHTEPATAYDFEATGVEAAPVLPTALVRPCNDLARLEISRDIPNDGAVQLSSLLSALPESVRAECSKATGDDYAGIDQEQARALVHQMTEDLIDKDLDAEQQNILDFRDIVAKQTQARQELLLLLRQSRCQFGADDAAAAFDETKRLQTVLQKRKQIVVDALELEGLDVDEEQLQGNEKVEEPELPAFSWYQPDKDGPEAKKARVE